MTDRIALLLLAGITALALIFTPWAAVNREVGARTLRALQLALYVAEAIGCCHRLACRAGIAAGGGALHRVRCLLHLPGGVREIGTILIA